jgi:predicted nucleic acid-binding protein
MHILDASVALAWVLDEAGSGAARTLVQDRQALAAPAFLLLECANVLSFEQRRGQVSHPESVAYFRAIAESPVAWLDDFPLAMVAHRLALETSHSAYDCIYLAAALAEDAVVATLDQRFAGAAQAAGYGDRIRLLTA